uniref:Carboxylesterase type B domain-containing protein n=1 Tax=Timema poppense TaxID=170557 RepID=A0A7R9DTW6_TIMPO|nr:unnamed protein product [Timema poppensis]
MNCSLVQANEVPWKYFDEEQFCLVLVLEEVLDLVSVLCQEPTVTVAQGTLRGQSVTSSYGLTYNSYLGIPYAQPPVGDLRFKVTIPPHKTQLRGKEPEMQPHMAQAASNKRQLWGKAEEKQPPSTQDEYKIVLQKVKTAST